MQYSQEELMQLLELGKQGIQQIILQQRQALA